MRQPPLEIDPETFFCCWLPAEITRLGSAAGLPERCIRVQLQGIDGGGWDLQVCRGQVTASAQDARHHPHLTLQLSVQDWRAAMVGEVEPHNLLAESLLPPAAAATDLLFLDTSAQRLISQLTGSFEFQIQNFHGRIWLLRATFGQQEWHDPPDAILSTDVQTYRAILQHELSAPEAVLSRRVMISGDVSKGLRIGQALFAKY
jgi:putative sterol carrier protein